jgi:hypothetical protein
MKKILLLTAVVLGACLLFGSTFISKVTVVEPVTAQAIEIPKRYVPTHAQNVWLHALEWCESRGKISAINPSDADGTPSYSSFQWKPSTFKYYAVKYNLLKGEDVDTEEELMAQMSVYENQKAIVTEMLNDPKVRWNNEFPDCTMRKVGLPPKY